MQIDINFHQTNTNFEFGPWYQYGEEVFFPWGFGLRNGSWDVSTAGDQTKEVQMINGGPARFYAVKQVTLTII